MICFFDLETKSTTDLRSCAAWRYSEAESADIICMAYAVEGREVRIWRPGQAIPKEFTEAEFFVARNAPFELSMSTNVLVKKYGFPARLADPRNYICTAALSRMHGLPASLEQSAEYLNKKFQKLPDGKRLIQLYCIPKKDGTFRPIPPEDWEKMLEYNRIDVESDREAFGTLSRLPNWAVEKEIFYHDFALNVRGIRIDTAALDKLLSVFNTATEEVNSAQRKLTTFVEDKKGRKIEKPLNVRSPKNLQAWLAARGYEIDDCKVDTIEALYDDADAAGDEEVKKVLAWRLFLGKASVKKFQAAKNRVSPDGRLRYFLKYFGAHTGRFSGEGFQVHNLPKSKWEKGLIPADEITRMIKEINPAMPYRDLIDTAKRILPGLIIPDKGNTFLAGDFAAVEARGIAYLSGCKSMLAGFAQDDKQNDKTNDTYSRMAKKINPSKPERQLGKRVILGCQYGVGAAKFYEVCKRAGESVSEDLAQNAVGAYRAAFPEIPAFWYALEDAFRQCWLSKQPKIIGVLRFERGGNYIRVKLPSGRWLYYHQVQIKDGQISYVNFGKKGARVKIWGGVLAENVTQAFCRDILCDRMLELEKNDLPVALHVHDEIVAEIKKIAPLAKQKVFDKILNTAPEWCKGFPLKTESEITSRYHK